MKTLLAAVLAAFCYLAESAGQVTIEASGSLTETGIGPLVEIATITVPTGFAIPSLGVTYNQEFDDDDSGFLTFFIYEGSTLVKTEIPRGKNLERVQLDLYVPSGPKRLKVLVAANYFDLDTPTLKMRLKVLDTPGEPEVDTAEITLLPDDFADVAMQGASSASDRIVFGRSNGVPVPKRQELARFEQVMNVNPDFEDNEAILYAPVFRIYPAPGTPISKFKGLALGQINANGSKFLLTVRGGHTPPVAHLEGTVLYYTIRFKNAFSNQFGVKSSDGSGSFTRTLYIEGTVDPTLRRGGAVTFGFDPQDQVPYSFTSVGRCSWFQRDAVFSGQHRRP